MNPSFIEPSPITLIDEAYEEVRRIAHNLMPHSLEHLGLKNALEQYCRTVMTSTELTLTLQIYGLDERLERSIELWVYRIIQELVTNVIKHAKATRVLIQLVYASELLHITVEDNGNGFVTTEGLKKGNLGLRYLIDRTAYLKGAVTIESELGIGSSIVIELPARPLTQLIK
ncbi:ATP-binding protein [uncultured Spirosoma sp.]|uniref:sensor histidine kinase n=1 Tax=uncultured Spirosoma sp. TaxID=278208 RepID=UPI002588A093|nr:ATP-binding protein [uncultured Spirosoma sp.]